MRRVFSWIVDHPKAIICVFAIAFIISALCKPLIAVNYDMHDYLPVGSPSAVSIDIMHEEFDGGVPNARVMVKNVTIPQALDIKERISAIDGVESITWLDDSISLNMPIEMAASSVVENYYREGNALYTITIDDKKRTEVVGAIRELIGEDSAMTGSAVSSVVATESTVKEISVIAVIAVAFAFLVLVITTTSWVEPVIVLLGLGVAIVINAGSNLIFGEISFVTNAAGSILQLAVSLDYSVFLLHRFNECRRLSESPREAMIEALSMSLSSILSSGLTTVIGFLALCLMRFRIGPDLGSALAKGVGISLITVFVFMPCLILITCRLRDRLEHRPFLPSFDGFGRLVRRVMFPLVAVFFTIMVPAYMASNANSFLYGASRIFGEDTKLGTDTKLIEDTFGKNDTYVLMVPTGDRTTQKALSDELHTLPQVTDIISYVDTVGMEIPTGYLDENTLKRLESDDYTRFVISINADYEGERTFDLIDNVHKIAAMYYDNQYYLAGEGISTHDLMQVVSSDMKKVNLIAIGAVFLVLLLTMRSIVLPIILVLSIETAIWINLSLPYFSDNAIFYLSYLIISCVQLGATVDYAILFTDRYKEFRILYDKKETIVKTISAVTVSILTSGSAMVVVGFLLGIFSTHGLISQLGYFLGKGTLFSLAIVLFVLPGLLYIFDRTFIKRNKSVSEAVRGDSND